MCETISRSVNKFVPKDRWVASLSNGETIFEDFMENKEPAWERLSKYIKKNNLSITSLRGQFTSTGREIKIPSGQEGYIQKKKAWCTGSAMGTFLCLGHVQGNKCRIVHASSNGDSTISIEDDPGEPWTIYRIDIRNKIGDTSATSKSK